MENQRELTFGERAVGLQFNPSGDPRVNKAKELCAELIDLVNSVGDAPSDYLTNTIKGEAIRKIMGAQMWAVKSLTWK